MGNENNSNNYSPSSRIIDIETERDRESRDRGRDRESKDRGRDRDSRDRGREGGRKHGTRSQRILLPVPIDEDIGKKKRTGEKKKEKEKEKLQEEEKEKEKEKEMEKGIEEGKKKEEEEAETKKWNNGRRLFRCTLCDYKCYMVRDIRKHAETKTHQAMKEKREKEVMQERNAMEKARYRNKSHTFLTVTIRRKNGEIIKTRELKKEELDIQFSFSVVFHCLVCEYKGNEEEMKEHRKSIDHIENLEREGKKEEEIIIRKKYKEESGGERITGKEVEIEIGKIGEKDKEREKEEQVATEGDKEIKKEVQ